MGLEQYKGDMEMCCRCSTCKFIPLQKIKGSEYSYVCPSIARYNFPRLLRRRQDEYRGGGAKERHELYA